MNNGFVVFVGVPKTVLLLLVLYRRGTNVFVAMAGVMAGGFVKYNEDVLVIASNTDVIWNQLPTALARVDVSLHIAETNGPPILGVTVVCPVPTGATVNVVVVNTVTTYTVLSAVIETDAGVPSTAEPIL
jgi:hypothetical protein